MQEPSPVSLGKGFRTAPWLVVCTALAGALLFQLGTLHLQHAIMWIISFLNHHVTPFYDPRGAARHLFWMQNAVLAGSLIGAFIIGCLVAGVAKRREMIATITLSFISLLITVTDFWMSVAMRAPVDPVLFPHIMIDQLSSSVLMIIGGIIVREIRSAARFTKPAPV